MYRSSKIHLKRLNPEQISELRALRDLYAKLYNLCIITLKGQYYKNKYILTPSELYSKVMRSDEALNLGKPYMYAVNIAVQNFKTSVFTHIKLPRHKKKNKGITIKAVYNGGVITLPQTPTTKEMTFTLPEQYKSLNTHIIHIQEAKPNYWELTITYNKLESQKRPKRINCVGVDVGVNNLLAVACSNGNTVLYDGRYIKYIIYQRRYAKRSNMRFINQMKDHINKIVSHFIKFCLENDVYEVIIGDVFKGYDKEKDVYKYYNYYSYGYLYKRIEQKCQEHGIKYHCVNESYTSKASFIDDDIVPHSLRGSKNYFSGKRIERGLYKSKNGILINADINGAYNILNKYERVSLEHLQKHPELIKQPARIKFNVRA